MPRKRGNGDGSYYRRKTGQWVAAISLTRGGKRERITRLAKSREHARMLLVELQREIRSPSPAPSAITVAEYLRSWLDTDVRPQLADGTHESYGYAVKNHIVPTVGGIRLADLSALHVREWLAILERKAAGGRTRENAFVVLKVALGQAVKLGLIPANPCARLPKPKVEREPIDPFTAHEVKTILSATADSRLAAVYRLAFGTGMRQGEMFALNWPDIDFGRGQVRVERQVTECKGGLKVKPPKTKAGIRTIALPRQVLDALHARRADALREGHAASDLVFTTARGGMMRRSNFGHRHWGGLLTKLGLRHRGFHHTRHTFATLALQAGVPLHVVSRILGHARPSITLDIYAHYLPADGAAAAEKVQDLIG